MHRSNLLRLRSNMFTFILTNKRLFTLTLLLPYFDEISICEHEYEVTDDVLNASLSAYTAKANNAYKHLKRVSVQSEHSSSQKFNPCLMRRHL